MNYYQMTGAVWLQREGTFCVKCSREITECLTISQEITGDGSLICFKDKTRKRKSALAE